MTPLASVDGCSASALGQLPAAVEGMAFGCGVVLMVLGLYLRVRLHDYQMSMEEQAKDGLLTEAQARWRIGAMRFSGPAVVLLGLALFSALFFG